MKAAFHEVSDSNAFSCRQATHFAQERIGDLDRSFHLIPDIREQYGCPYFGSQGFSGQLPSPCLRFHFWQRGQ